MVRLLTAWLENILGSIKPASFFNTFTMDFLEFFSKVLIGDISVNAIVSSFRAFNVVLFSRVLNLTTSQDVV